MIIAEGKEGGDIEFLSVGSDQAQTWESFTERPCALEQPETVYEANTSPCPASPATQGHTRAHSL